jgi:ATPase subunit of ABC transporter with duplicated ATPase domains
VLLCFYFFFCYRHLPALAHALNTYQGGLVLVSHDDSFVKKIRIDDTIDLGVELNVD